MIGRLELLGARLGRWIHRAACRRRQHRPGGRIIQHPRTWYFRCDRCGLESKLGYGGQAPRWAEQLASDTARRRMLEQLLEAGDLEGFIKYFLLIAWHRR